MFDKSPIFSATEKHDKKAKDNDAHVTKNKNEHPAVKRSDDIHRRKGEK